MGAGPRSRQHPQGLRVKGARQRPGTVLYHPLLPRQVTGNLEEAQRTGELWQKTYPRELDALGLSSVVYQTAGNFQKSLEVCKRAIEINPSWAPGPVNLAWTYLAMERYVDAERTVQQASERKLLVPTF